VGTKKECITKFPRSYFYTDCQRPKCRKYLTSAATIRPATDREIIFSTALRTRSSGGIDPERPRYRKRDSEDIVVDRIDLLDGGRSQKTKGGLQRLVGSLRRTKTDQAIQSGQGNSVRQVGTDDIGDGGEKCNSYYFVAERLAERYRCLIGPHPDQIDESTELQAEISRPLERSRSKHGQYEMEGDYDRGWEGGDDIFGARECRYGMIERIRGNDTSCQCLGFDVRRGDRS
jgi:hypothetical protein